VPIRSRRSISDLFNQVREYDVVLTPDAPLSLALNRRVETPRLGRFAATPRMLASGEFNPRDERPLFHELLAKTDLPWKQAAFLVENVLSAWDETGAMDAILDYDEFDNRATRTAVNTISQAESSYRDVIENPIEEETDVAVIGEDQFTELDKRILPAEYDTVDPFGAGEFQLPEFRVYDSPTAIVDALVENIDAEKAAEVGIVLEQSSQYRPLLESAFEAANIPYYGGPGYAEDLDLRTFIRLLRLSHLAGDVRVREVRGVLSQIGQFPAIDDDDKLLTSVNTPEIESLQSILADLNGATFRNAIRSFENWAESDLSPLERELERLGTLDLEATSSRIDDLAFYLDTFEVPIQREDSGVLLASARSSVYVDRPVVFYLGLSADWTHSIKDRPWIDTQQKDAKYLQQFQLLLQNGQEQYYLVQNAEAGQAVTPCLYFHDLLDDSFTEFRDLDHVIHGGGFEEATAKSGFKREPVPDAPPVEEETTVSNSTLKVLANSPRDVFFDEVVAQPEKDYFTKGNLFHDFAEFYVVHPETVRETPLAELVDVGVDTLRAFTQDLDEPLLRTEIEAGFQNIMTFVDDFPPQSVSFDVYEKWWDDNLFADYFGQSISHSTTTEQWFSEPSFGGKGMIDLIHSPDVLVDFKTSAKKSPQQVVSNADMGDISDTPDFQAVLYLAHHRRVVPDRKLTFRFVHLTDNLDDVVTGDAEIEDTFTDVTYHPDYFADFVASETAFDLLTEGVSENNDRRKTLERLEYDVYREFFEEWGFPDVSDKDEVLERDVFDAFTRVAQDKVGEYKYVRNGVRSALRKLVDIRSKRFFEDDVTGFETYLRTQLENLNDYKKTRFPVGDNPNWDRVNHPDLILSGGSDD
jgi:hypothetical protein